MKWFGCGPRRKQPIELNVPREQAAPSRPEDEEEVTQALPRTRRGRRCDPKVGHLKDPWKSHAVNRLLAEFARDGDWDLVRAIVQGNHFSDINRKCSDGFTALDYSICHGRYDVVKLLVNAGADLSPTLSHVPLRHAAFTGQREMVELLLDKGAELACNGTTYTPLHFASFSGHLEVVKLLVDRGADIESKAKGSIKPLHLAAGNGNVDVVRYLLEKGVQFDSKGNSKFTALDFAAEKGQAEVVRLLLEPQGLSEMGTEARKAYLYPPIQYAAFRGHVHVVNMFLDLGLPMDGKSTRGYPILGYAAEAGQLKVVQLLLDRGADVGGAEDFVFSPLHSAAGHGHLNVVELLLDYGADIDCHKPGLSPVEFARQQGKMEVVNLLLKRGAICKGRL